VERSVAVCSLVVRRAADYIFHRFKQRSEPHIRLLADPKGEPAIAGEEFRTPPQLTSKIK